MDFIRTVVGHFTGETSASAQLNNYVSPHGIQIDEDTEAPSRVHKKQNWGHLKKQSWLDGNTPIAEDKIRIVCISDTHDKTDKLIVPDGDVLIHAGDFTSKGRLKEVERFNTFLGTLPHKHKVVIAGNHELSFGLAENHVDITTVERLLGRSGAESIRNGMRERNITHPRELLTDCIYLQDSGAKVCGLNFWGSPWTPYFHGWAYNARRGGECLQIWDLIPTDTDVVITHGPPLGIGDLCFSQERAGCVELLETLTKRVKPKLHVFGHIHEGHGLKTDGTTLYANASTCNLMYRPSNAPIVLDMPLPEGYTKDSFERLPQ